MSSIRQLVIQVLRLGYLSTDLERQLQQLCQEMVSLDDIDALTRLQQAISCGQIQRVSQITSQWDAPVGQSIA
jgi:hypothetical protein